MAATATAAAPRISTEAPKPLRGAERRRRFERRARTTLACALAGFVAVQLTFSLFLSRRAKVLRDPPYWTKHDTLQERLAATPHPVTVVMLGSSRTAFGFNGHLLEEKLTAEMGRPVVAFNLGVYGAGPVTERVYLGRLLASGIKPDLLLVDVTPSLLQDQTPPEDAYRLPAERLSWRDVPIVRRYAGPLGAELRWNWWFSAALPVYAHRLTILSGYAPFLIPPMRRAEWWGQMNPSGWVALPASPREGPSRDRALKLVRQEWGPKMAALRPGGAACQALEDLLSLAKEREIPTRLVLMPEGPAMRGLYPPAVWREVHTLLENLSRKHGSLLVNAREWIEEGDFSDSHHLLPQGARLFTERLGGEVIRPALEKLKGEKN